MYVERFSVKVVQPDESIVNQLHHLLDLIPDDNLALMIDNCVAQLLRFHDPNIHGQMAPPELLGDI
ncbi:hypothetical protein BHQ19_10210 [Mycolicibacterium porcinum]|nr:hypothetical protein BHQ19_10210 [Mycolicibacterium porcinum]